MSDFDVVYEKDKVLGDYLICKHCGQRVERGIVSVSGHWSDCKERIKKQGLTIFEVITNDVVCAARESQFGKDFVDFTKKMNDAGYDVIISVKKRRKIDFSPVVRIWRNIFGQIIKTK